jgi:phospho-N-acetylmuramoyl-pentapeptide-transferase
VVVERELIGKQTVDSTLMTGERRAKDSNIIVRNINGVSHRFAEVKTPITYLFLS